MKIEILGEKCEVAVNGKTLKIKLDDSAYACGAEQVIETGMMKAVNVRTRYKEGKVMGIGLTMVKGEVEVDGDGMGKCWVGNLTGDAVTIGHRFVVEHVKGWVQDEEEEKMEDPNQKANNREQRML
jgi:hypothetical protein